MAHTPKRGPSRAFVVIVGLLGATLGGLHLGELWLAPRTSRWGDLDVAELGSGTTTFIVLHGRGGRARHGIALAEAMREHLPGRYLVPEGPYSIWDGHGWLIWDESTERMVLDEGSALRSRASLLEVAARARREGATRLVVAGISEGAQMAVDVGLALEPPPDAIVMLAGNWLPTWRSAGVPGRHIVIAHGRDDAIFDFASIELLEGELRRRGAVVTFLPFEGGHEVGPIEPLAAALAPMLGAP